MNCQPSLLLLLEKARFETPKDVSCPLLSSSAVPDAHLSSLRHVTAGVLFRQFLLSALACGSFSPVPCFFRASVCVQELCVAIKPRQYCYRAECSPVGLLCSFFNLQGTQRKVYLQAPDEVNDPYGQQFYLNVRKFRNKLARHARSIALSCTGSVAWLNRVTF